MFIPFDAAMSPQLTKSGETFPHVQRDVHNTFIASEFVIVKKPNFAIFIISSNTPKIYQQVMDK